MYNKDRINVVFGEVIHGMDVVKAMKNVGLPDETTTMPVTIVDCGQVTFLYFECNILLGKRKERCTVFVLSKTTEAGPPLCHDQLGNHARITDYFPYRIIGMNKVKRIVRDFKVRQSG